MQRGRNEEARSLASLKGVQQSFREQRLEGGELSLSEILFWVIVLVVFMELPRQR